MLRPALLAVVLLSILCGCVSLPAVDEDIARASRTGDARGALDLMRKQEERIAKAPFLDGNSIKLLRGGRAAYAEMTAAITGARRRIDMESYTFDEVEGGKFADLLLAKRAQGLDVNLIYDAWGSSDTPAALFDRLRQGGVKVVEYNPLSPTEALDLNKRDHRKLLVVDGAIAITGGVNVSIVYENRRQPPGAAPDPNLMPWRDTDVRIEGPVVAQFERFFMETWRQQKGEAIADPPATPQTPQGEVLIQAIDGAPDDDRPLIYRTLMIAITLARSSVHLTTGYFVPTPDLSKALKEAARRGIDVRIVVPHVSDSSASVSAGRGYYAGLMKAGVHIYERQGAVLHAKTAVVDGAWSAVGSSNLDWRSVIYNNEIDAIILNRDFGQQMEAMFNDDVAASHEIDPKRWADRPFRERIDEFGARLLQFLL